MSGESEQATANQFPIAIVMGLAHGQTSPWTALRPEPIAALAGAYVADKTGTNTRLHSEINGEEQLLYTGFTLKLHRDEAESYYFNLRGERPSLFVICSDDETGGLTPFLVTCNYDEATAHMEVEEHVFSLPIPPEVYRWIEQFVVKHYRPSQKKKKRKRENWKNQATK